MLVSVLSGITSVNAADKSTENKSNWVGMASGAAIKADGTVWAWGGLANADVVTSERALSQTKLIKSPTLLKGIADVKAVAAGPSFALALKKDGTVWAWGNNHDGQLGDGTQSVVDPVTYKTITSANRDIPIQAKGLTDVVSIAADWTRSYAITSDGSLWGWGGFYYRNVERLICFDSDSLIINMPSIITE